MFSRRNFLSKSFLTSLGLVWGSTASSCQTNEAKAINAKVNTVPKVISTWKNEKANQAAMQVLLKNNGSALDAVEAGVKIPEGDPLDQSVGYGGYPDRDGKVTLDACIMDAEGNAGSVCFLQHIKHPISVARQVMEKTPHVILAGQGALEFALANGFSKENLLTERTHKEWEEWKKEAKYQPIINIENHDTIGMIAQDAQGDISGACTTSGLAFKMHGRVGDSPIIGAGLYIDNEIGGAAATGMGEAVLKSLGSFLVVELMRQGYTPGDACKEAVMRTVRKQKNYKDFQIGYIAMNKQGESGSFSLHKGFSYTFSERKSTTVTPSASYLQK